MPAVDEVSQLPCIDEQNVAPPVAELPVRLVPREKPAGGRNHRAVEELAWKSNHAIDQIGLNDCLPNLAFAT